MYVTCVISIHLVCPYLPLALCAFIGLCVYIKEMHPAAAHVEYITYVVCMGYIATVCTIPCSCILLLTTVAKGLRPWLYRVCC